MALWNSEPMSCKRSHLQAILVQLAAPSCKSIVMCPIFASDCLFCFLCPEPWIWSFSGQTVARNDGRPRGPAHSTERQTSYECRQYSATVWNEKYNAGVWSAVQRTVQWNTMQCNTYDIQCNSGQSQFIEKYIIINFDRLDFCMKLVSACC